MPNMRLIRPVNQPVTDYPLPEGYTFSNYQGPKDIGPWCECCRKGLISDTAGEEAFVNAMIKVTDVCPEKDIFFIDHEGEHVGTFTAYVRGEDHVGVMHMVGIRPDYRGKGLSNAMGPVAVRKLIAQGVRYMSLVTDDWRVGAVFSYLRAGFYPTPYKEDTVEIWQSFMQKYGIPELPLYDENFSLICTLKPQPQK